MPRGNVYVSSAMHSTEPLHIIITITVSIFAFMSRMLIAQQHPQRHSASKWDKLLLSSARVMCEFHRNWFVSDTVGVAQESAMRKEHLIRVIGSSKIMCSIYLWLLSHLWRAKVKMHFTATRGRTSFMAKQNLKRIKSENKRPSTGNIFVIENRDTAHTHPTVTVTARGQFCLSSSKI